VIYHPCCCRFRVWICAVLAMGLTAVIAVPGQTDDKATSREKQIADLEKKIQEMNKKLAELRRGNDGGTAAPIVEGPLPAAWIKGLTWRSIGPAAMGGRIIGISVYEADPSTYWVATASGGLLKTINNGDTFEHQFDHESTVSLGAVCVAPSDRNIVWVGTGENNPRNSVSYGDGVYKSTDGGKTWKNMGLRKSFQIGSIRIHPKNPNIVYVGALGRLYGPNEERGLFKTTDGGETWQKILYVDDKTGVIDISMHPTNPDTLLVATYERQRDSYDTNDPSKKYGPGSGLYKTTDGGKTFTKLIKGLPTCALGRMGIEYYRKNPNTVFLILESEKIGMGPKPKAGTGNGYFGAFTFGEESEEAGARLTRVAEDGPADKAGLTTGDVVTAINGKAIHSGAELMEESRNHKAGDKVKVKFIREGKTKEVELTVGERPARRPFGGGRGGGDPKHPYAAALGGQIENAQDKQGPDGFQYGGIYKSTNGGDSWTRINSLNPRPMYFSQIRVDPSDENYVYVLGISMARSTDGGKTFRITGGRGVHADQHALWIDPHDGRHMILGCDGGFYVTYDRMANWDHLNHTAIGQFYQVAVDPRPRYYVYGGLQDNGTWGGPSYTHTGIGPINEDWIMVGGGDGFRCAVDPNDPDEIYYESQNGGFGRRNLRTGEVASIRPERPGQGRRLREPGQAGPPGQPGQQRPGAQGPRYRFNWNAPFILSRHNSRIYYCAGNRVFRSLDRGNDLQVISPEITRTEKGSATALAESPRNPNVLYVGTDDGALWITQDGGKEWKNISANVGLPGPRCIATIEPSRFAEGRCYVAFDGHRQDDDSPLLYVTEDFGKTWSSITANLPWGSTRCLREDIQNPNLLFVGTEFAVWVSIDRGHYWTKLNNNLPTVAVHDFAIHPTAGEIVAATHGRSLWILNITPLRQMTTEIAKAKAHLFEPVTAVRWITEPRHGGTNRRFVGENPPPGAQIYYSVAKKPDKISLSVVDYAGKTVRELRASGEPGLHRVSWDLSMRSPRPPRGGAAAAPGSQGTEPGARAGRRASQAAGVQAAPGQPAAGQATQEQPAGGRRAGGRGGFGRGGFGARPVAPGTYRVVLTVDGEQFMQPLRVEADPAAPQGLIASDGQEPVQNDPDDDDPDPGLR
jgi:photosystem II stability/assembly factor-like uncharacterized protein